MDFTGKSRSCALFYLLGKWSGLVLMSFQDLLCNSAIVYKHQHIVFQSGSVFAKAPVCLGSLWLWQVADQKIWEVLAKRQPGVAPGCVSLLCDGSSDILLPSLAPLCLLADELDHSKSFSAPGKTFIYKYNF